MNSFSNKEFDYHFLIEDCTAKDILDQNINDVSMFLCCRLGRHSKETSEMVESSSLGHLLSFSQMQL